MVLHPSGAPSVVLHPSASQMVCWCCMMFAGSQMVLHPHQLCSGCIPDGVLDSWQGASALNVWQAPDGAASVWHDGGQLAGCIRYPLK